MKVMEPTIPTVFVAVCNTCGEEIDVPVISDTFEKVDGIPAYVLRLENVDIEAHLLTHDVNLP